MALVNMKNDANFFRESGYSDLYIFSKGRPSSASFFASHILPRRKIALSNSAIGSAERDQSQKSLFRGSLTIPLRQYYEVRENLPVVNLLLTETSSWLSKIA